MEQRRLGRTGLLVSRIALGTMTFGRDTGADEASSILRRFVDAGGTLVDTANRYADGESERILGRLLGPSGVVRRDDVVLATKAGSSMGSGPLARGGSRAHLLRALDDSLGRLQTSYVDLWQLHVWDAVTPLEETLAAFDTAVSSGRTRYVGVSNFAGWQTAQAATWQAAWPGRAPVVSTQMEYSLLSRGVEREVLPACAALGVGMLPWSPLGRGVLSGKYRDGTPTDSRGASQMAPFVAPYRDDAAGRIVEAVCTAADGLGVAPVAVALAWVRDRPGVTSPIVGARTNAQLAGSLDAESLDLPEEIRRALDDVSAPPIGYPERTG